MEVALKIDVDTHQGLKLGVRRLADGLERAGVAASFYISMGPDNSGRAILRVFTNRGFLGKMTRTRAVGMYGLRTVLSGTLLPARPIALAFPSIVRELQNRGFEVGVHGYDHVKWQDGIDRIGVGKIRSEIEDSIEAFRAIFRESPRGFAAPGWRVNSVALEILDHAGLKYQSNTRGRTPFRCRVDGSTLGTAEIPTTLPTLDELMGRRGLQTEASLLAFYLDQFRSESLNVHTIHAETEGAGQFGFFMKLIEALKQRGAKFVTLESVASKLEAAELPAYEVVRTTLPGRAGWISSQGPEH